MLSTYSPQRESGGVMYFHSPGHNPEYDPHSAIREIRRSLSRSPSKPYFRNASANGPIPFTSSPLSPSRRSTSDNFLHLNAYTSPHTSRGPQTTRVQRPAVRRTCQTPGTYRIRTSPKSPSKRILSDSLDGGNPTPMLRKRRSTEMEDDFDITSEEKENLQQNEEQLMLWKSSQTRQEKRRSGGLLSELAPLSPLKRTDGPMNIDQPDFGSPSAKRRSIHGPSTLDFSIFEADNLRDSIDQTRSQDDNDWFRNSSPFSASRFSTIPKRSSSLRKSTLQQRQSEKPSPFKSTPMYELSQGCFETSPAAGPKKPVRISLNDHLEPLPRDSPFSSQGYLLNASIHPVTSGQDNNQTSQFRHPLSRTMTQSSSTPSVQDDSPTHEPIRRPDRPKSYEFSKSLPIGALRPFIDETEMSEPSQGSFATPANYKSARPLPAAFMSTGLISKKNRNVDEPDAGLPKAHMPDTPCKKQSTIFASNDQVVPPIPAVKNLRTSLGTPSTPNEGAFGIVRAAPFPWAKSVGIFGARSKQNLARKASFASIDGDEKLASQSPSYQGDSQSTDNDYPPTPTKHIASEIPRAASVSPSPRHSLGKNKILSASIYNPYFANSKLSPVQPSPEHLEGDSDSEMADSPSATLKPKLLLNLVHMPSPSFTQSRLLKNLNSPTPLSRKALVISSPQTHFIERTKMARFPVSPRLTNIDRISPHTPDDGFLPPDPSGLSISGKSDRYFIRPGSSHLPSVPATPTGPRESFGNFSNRPSLNLNAPEVADVDHSLTSKFEKSDLVGTGEFSQVYRVSQGPRTSPFQKSFASATRPSSRGSIPEQVWAVKKSRYPYTGPKDRQRKVHEVDVLKALGHNDHILSFVDSWEDRGHLYIQTEFCEEGTLDIFLAHVGLRARLDDFRIWKMLLELSLGLKHVHDSGFIHLDLKPANILITFEGVLKIADFGMATKWPAKAGIEGEGDREYIGPEVLMGKYDKPADIFALGLIMLETAGNVELPDNGLSWQKLRNGDMSDVPSLTWSSVDSNILRDASGNPVAEEDVSDEDQHATDGHQVASRKFDGDGALHMTRSGELTNPPTFMIDATNEQALDRVVRWMISPEPLDRPTINQVLQTQGVQWAEARRRAGATIFEGNWGPADEILAEDAEMIDV